MIRRTMEPSEVNLIRRPRACVLVALLSTGCADDSASETAGERELSEADDVSEMPDAPPSADDDEAATTGDDAAAPSDPDETDDDTTADPEMDDDVPSTSSDEAGTVPEPDEMPADGAAPEVPETPGERRGGTLGRFTVTLAQESSDYATFDGKIYEAPVPSRVGWEMTVEDGDCRLELPRLGECAESCELPQFCAADTNTCVGERPTVSVGAVTVWGLATVGETPSFTLEPLNPTTNAYNATGPAALVYPPFEPGAPVVLEASGGALEPFTVGAFGIEPLRLDGEEPLSFTGEEDVPFLWETGTVESAFVEVIVDISFHGGTKGHIVCTTEDDGELTIGQAMVQGLIDLGVAGFPHVELTRRTTSFANVADDHVELNVVSRRTRLLSVPGVTSCVDDSECDADETCRDDSTCG